MKYRDSDILSYLDITSKVILENSTDFILIFDSEGKIHFFNKSAQKILDFSKNVNSNFFEVIERIENINIRNILSKNNKIISVRIDMQNSIGETIESFGNINLINKSENSKHFIYSSTVYNTNKTYLLNKKIYESEEKYIKLVNQSTDCVILHEDGIITFVNNAGIKILGAKKASEIVGRTNISFVHPDYREEISKRISEIQTTRKSLPWLEQKFIKIDGSAIDVEAASTSIELNGEKVIQLIVKDISERKIAEKKLLSSENQISAFVRALPDDVYVLNEDGIYVDVISSIKSKRKRGQSIFNVFSESTAQKILTTIRNTIQNKKSYSIEYQYENNYFEGKTSLLDVEDEKNRVLWISRDISIRKKAELAIKKNEEIFNSFIEQSSDGICIVDQDGKVIIWNNAREKISGYPKDEIIGKYIWDVQWLLMKDKTTSTFTLEQLKQNTLNLLNRTTDDFGSTKVRNTEILTKNLETKNVETFIFPMDTAFGRKIGSICRDVTKTKQTEEILINAKKIAEKANEAKSLFIAKISHEIRTPLNGIIGFANILYENETDIEKKEMLSIINTSGETLLKLISDILDFSKIESGKIKLQENEFDLKELVESTIKSFQIVANKKNLELEYSFCENAGNMVIGDKIAIKQILVNLINNAIKFTDFGKINIQLNCEKINNDSINAFVTVTDTGKGIHKTVIEHLFSDDLSISFNDSEKSNGLGLSIVKSLVKLMNGEISVESQVDKGSTFITKIPLLISKNKALSVPKIGDFDNDKNKKIKILVAEDDLTNQHLIKAFAKNKPWDLVIVENGEKAVKEFETNKYNIILMDIQMPIMNGIDATKLIRKFENSTDKTHIPIIALTAYAMESDKQKCFDAGMDAFISKPININKLFSTINKFTN